MVYQIILILMETFSGCGKKFYKCGFTTESKKDEEPESENIGLPNNESQENTQNDHNHLLG